MYKATYKCRLCGETFDGSLAGTVKREVDSHTITTMVGLYGHQKFGFDTITERVSHNCPDGSIGYADFIGFRKED